MKSVCDVGAAARGQRRLVQALGVAGGGEAEIYTLEYENTCTVFEASGEIVEIH